MSTHAKDEITPAGWWSLNADMLGLVETFVEPKNLWALALAEQRCRDAAQPRLQGLATLRHEPFNMLGSEILDTKYNLTNQGLGAAGAQTLAAIIAGGHTAHVSGLYLSMNNLGDDGMQALAPALRHLPSLVFLHLSANNIREAGAAALANAATDGALSQLQSLHLNDNSIGDGGMQAVSAAIAGGGKVLSQLHYLSLQRNNIGNVGAQSLAAAFVGGKSSAMRNLYLNANEIGDVGMQAFSAAIFCGGLPVIENVYLYDNPGSHRAVTLAVAGWRRDVGNRRAANVIGVDASQL